MYMKPMIRYDFKSSVGKASSISYYTVSFQLLGAGLIILGIILLVDDSVLLEFIGKLPIGSDVVEEGVYGCVYRYKFVNNLIMIAVSSVNRSNWLTNFAYIMLVAGSVFLVIAGTGLFGACYKVECLLIVVCPILFSFCNKRSIIVLA
jgi:tetraspanin-18